MSLSKILVLGLCLLCAFPLAADMVLIQSNGGVGSNNGNSMGYGTGANVAIAANGAWATPPAGSSWISYGQTTTVGPAAGTTITFTHLFNLALNKTYTGSIDVWADDGTNVKMDGNVLFDYPTNFFSASGEGANCSIDPISCPPPKFGHVALSIVGPGDHTLTFDVVQHPLIWGGDPDGYGLLYSGQVSSVPDGGVTLTLLGGVLVGVETLRRKLRV